MLDKKAQTMYDRINKTDKTIADLLAQIEDAQKARKKLKKDYHTHQVCTMGGTVKKHLENPDLPTAEDMEVLMELAFSQPAVRKKLNEIMETRQRELEEAEAKALAEAQADTAVKPVPDEDDDAKDDSHNGDILSNILGAEE